MNKKLFEGKDFDSLRESAKAILNEKKIDDENYHVNTAGFRVSIKNPANFGVISGNNSSKMERDVNVDAAEEFDYNGIKVKSISGKIDDKNKPSQVYENFNILIIIKLTDGTIITSDCNKYFIVQKIPNGVKDIKKDRNWMSIENGITNPTECMLDLYREAMEELKQNTPEQDAKKIG
jgi:hypothetical protein